MKNLFPEIVQNGFVVDDLDAALKCWTAEAGVGPFFLAEHVKIARYLWNGQPSELDLSLAFGHAGSIQIELICQHNDAPSSFRHHLATKGPGFHHVCHRTRKFDDVYRIAKERNLKVDSEGEISGGARFCYFSFDQPSLPLMEIISLTDRGAAMHERIREASVGWNGAEPVRPLHLSASDPLAR
ncbi:VOC family protein [Bradyrhizobium liaoningense]